VAGQRPLQAIEGFRVASEGEIAAPQDVQGVPHAVRVIDLFEGVLGLPQVVDSLPGPAKVKQRPSQAPQCDAFAELVADRAVQFQGTPVQVKGLVRASQPLIGVGEVVRRLRLAHPVADLAPDRQRPFQAADPF
jgi:hypothetical protein